MAWPRPRAAAFLERSKGKASSRPRATVFRTARARLRMSSNAENLQRQTHVVCDRSIGDELEVLEDHAQIAPQVGSCLGLSFEASTPPTRVCRWLGLGPIEHL